ncbi:SAM-dependent methyltransferase [Spirosoma montaniterrae]|uniref:SAM-dependent methyltransferase n=1 Tax=Spirosoma montaniterrae TaxID=1178516 RepID=A0A1P9WUZ5_9BACT|nr:SAM-dependent methyltransferase [Spirosoma montaniterrae]AQG79194.1 SAM-dependent methyltransferase [Spirosoma montaniterrae]
MPFELSTTVPWGRNLNEYRAMFNLRDEDLNKRIVSVGDGPASFNAEMTQLRKNVVSIDPIYKFSTAELRQRIMETKDVVIEQTKNNLQKFVWTKIKTIEELATIRLAAMNHFLEDFEKGKRAFRYVDHEMPARTAFGNASFDLGLSSHFLLLYSQLGLDFHLATLTEMLRICNQVRIFPILNLNAEQSELVADLIKHLESDFIIEIVNVDYEFQKNGNQMLQLTHK